MLSLGFLDPGWERSSLLWGTDLTPTDPKADVEILKSPGNKWKSELMLLAPKANRGRLVMCAQFCPTVYRRSRFFPFVPPLVLLLAVLVTLELRKRNEDLSAVATHNVS
jgi:hypothetical protein